MTTKAEVKAWAVKNPQGNILTLSVRPNSSWSAQSAAAGALSTGPTTWELLEIIGYKLVEVLITEIKE